MYYKSERRAVHGGRAKYISHNGQKILDFSASINPFPPNINLQVPVDALYQYPDDDYSLLKQVIARHHGCSSDNVTVGNGSVEVIRTLCHTILKPGKTFFASSQTFAEYELSARLAGAEPSELDQADLVFICNPDNPSGKLLTRNEIETICIERTKKDSIICIDEAFIDMADPNQTAIPLQNYGVFILRSLTKSFAIPGIRFGYGIGNPELIASMEVMRPPWTVNALAESVTISAFSHYDELNYSRSRIEEEKSRLIKEIQKSGWTCEPGSANYLLIDTQWDARIITELFMKQNILVRDCTSFNLPNCIRIAIRTPEENNQLIKALESVHQCMR